MSDEFPPAVVAAPKLARRAAELVAVARELGFSDAHVRLLRDRRVQAMVHGDALPVSHRGTVRQVHARVVHRGRSLTLSSTDSSTDAVRAQLEAARSLMETSAKELFAGTPPAAKAPPTGPFDALAASDPALSPADPEAIRGLALALARPTGAHTRVVALARAEAVARLDGARVAWQHTHLDVSLSDGPVRLARRWRTLAAMGPAAGLVERFQARRDWAASPPVALPDTPTRVVVHPEAGGALLSALVRLPLRTRRVSDRLSVLADPWVVGGLGAQPFGPFGGATRPVPLIEGGLQRRRWSADVVGDLRVGLGGRSLSRLVGETDTGVLVVGWRRVDIHPETGRCRLVGYGRTLQDGERSVPVPRVLVEGRLPELFRQLAAIGADPCATGTVRSPTLVFDGVQVGA